MSDFKQSNDTAVNPQDRHQCSGDGPEEMIKI